MRALVQRVLNARVDVGDECVGRIDGGLLVLVGVTHSDTTDQAATLARKVHGLRILRGETSVADTPTAAILVVSQFTLYGALERGRRPSWSAAAPGAHAEPIVEAMVADLRRLGAEVATGRFGADMRVASVNDGPITLLLEA